MVFGLFSKTKKSDDTLKKQGQSSKKQAKNKKKNNSLPVKVISENGLITDSNGRHKLVAKISPINCELMDNADLDEVFEALFTATSFHQGRWGILIQSEKIDVGRNISNIKLYQETVDNETDSELLEMQKKMLEEYKASERNVLNFYVIFEHRGKVAQAYEVLTDTIMHFRKEIMNANFELSMLDGEQVRQMIYERSYPVSSKYEPYQEGMTLDDIFPREMNIQYDKPQLIRNDNQVHRFVAINQLPTNVSQYRWLNKIWQVSGDLAVMITMTPKNKATIIDELDKAAREIGSKAYNARREKDKQRLQSEKDSALDLMQQIGSDNISLFDVNFTIGMSGKNEDELDNLYHTIKGKIGSTLARSCDLVYKGFDPMWTTFPILVENDITKNYIWNLTNGDVASLIPFDSSEFMDSYGIVQGENVNSRGLVISDPYNEKKYPNGHQVILAYSGAGKTFAIRTDIVRHKPYRDFIGIFDIERDIRLPFGDRIKFSADGKYITNPFHIRNAIIDSDNDSDIDEIDIGNYLATKIMDLITFFKWIHRDMSAYDESLLEVALRRTFAKAGLTFESLELPSVFPTFTEFEKVLTELIEEARSEREKESYVNQLAIFNPFINGAYSKMFNGQTNWDFESKDRLIVWDISRVNEAVRKPLYDLLLKDVWQFCKVDRSKTKRIYVDEAHEFSDPRNPQTMEFLSICVKRGRKYGLSLVTATQNLPDFLSVERYGQAIIDNSFFKLFMAMGENDLPMLEKTYKFNRRELKILSQSTRAKSGKGKGLFMIGAQRVEIQVRASKEELEIVDPAQYEELYKTPSRYKRFLG